MMKKDRPTSSELSNILLDALSPQSLALVSVPHEGRRQGFLYSLGGDVFGGVAPSGMSGWGGAVFLLLGYTKNFLIRFIINHYGKTRTIGKVHPFL